MGGVVRCGTVFSLLILGVACGGPGLPSAVDPPPPPAPVQSPTPVDVPPLEGPATVYVFSGPLSYPVRDYTNHSTYVLYDNGAFALRYETLSGPPYVGVYQRENDDVFFRFAGDSRSGAAGTFRGDYLDVRYGDIMEHSDFENAVYLRSQ